MGQCASVGTTHNSGQDGSCMVCDCCNRGRNNGCFAIMREHRSRFYIARKCLVMLLCWHKYEIGEDDNLSGSSLTCQINLLNNNR
ncbi:hypothetical protein K1719_019346 [Acacia pycnantha]|nr:hypothetical protein K1719_019346 [Acacia pycnantha]